MSKDPILKMNVRILTPVEYESIERVVAKPSLRFLLRALLYTGMRYQELLRLKQNPAGFIPERSCIHVKSGKKLSVYSERYVHLTPTGVQAITDFLADERIEYPSPSAMTRNLCMWARSAHLEPAPKLAGDIINSGANAGRERQNVWGMSVKTFRKSWESWLLISYPEQLPLIQLSQGHTAATALAHYLAVPFSQDEKDRIKTWTSGWMS